MRAKRSRLPPLTAVRAFEAAARHLSFKDAATELCVSQSAVSHQIKLLEEFLGLRLFLRKPRAVTLTPEGMIYYPALSAALDNIAEATKTIKSGASMRKLKLHVYSTFTIRWLLPRLHDFYVSFPEIEVQLYTAQDDIDFLTSDLHASIMITNAPQKDVHYEPLFKPDLFPVCSPNYYENHREQLSSGDLSKLTILNVFLSPDDWPTWLEANGYSDIDPSSGLQFESYEVALASAAQGMGIAMGQQPYLEGDLINGNLIEVFPAGRVSNPKMWYLACRKGDEAHERIACFSSWLKTQIDADAPVLSSKMLAQA